MLETTHTHHHDSDVSDVIPDTQQHATYSSNTLCVRFCHPTGSSPPDSCVLVATTGGFQHQQPTNQTQSDVG